MSILRNQLLASWRQPSPLTFFLLPVSLLYAALMALRKLLYRLRLFTSYRAPVPVVVVGNLTVGGSGKTPLVIYLVEQLRQAGVSPGVISRGYGGSGSENSGHFPLRVTSATPPLQCGDEAALIVRRTSVPMVVGPNRKDAIRHLLKHSECDVIISDDGLQHYALAREIEVCVVDRTVVSSNSFMLPAGPYREPASRINSVDFVVSHVAVNDSSKGELQMNLVPQAPRPLLAPHNNLKWSAAGKVHAIAGIGQPQRFFDTCTKMGLRIIPHAFPDHYQFSAGDIQFNDDLPVLMTEKDAVKCAQIATQKHWYLPVSAKLNQPFAEQLIALLRSKGLTV